MKGIMSEQEEKWNDNNKDDKEDKKDKNILYNNTNKF
jgi:hypothetical protein